LEIPWRKKKKHQQQNIRPSELTFGRPNKIEIVPEKEFIKSISNFGEDRSLAG